MALMKRVGITALVLLALGLGLWAVWHKEAISALLRPGASATSVQAVTPHPSQLPAAPSPAPSIVDQLLQEAIALRDRGDMTNALARLHEASDREPNNATVLEEIAKTYESMQLFDRSNAMWRRLQEMGPSAGAAYELADQRLKLSVPTSSTGGAISKSGRSISEVLGAEVEQMPSNPILKITEVTATEIPDVDAEKNLKFQVAVAKQPNTVIDDTKVQIRVFLFDTVADKKKIDLTNADVTYDPFATHDWTGSSPAIFTVRYRRAKKTASEASHRRYFGYLIRAYYDGRLQAIGLDPEQLLSRFPPSVIAASPSPPDVSRPSFDTTADFAKYAMKLREQGLLEVQPRLLVPTSSAVIQRQSEERLRQEAEQKSQQSDDKTKK